MECHALHIYSIFISIYIRMLLTYKSLEWINEHKRKYKNNKNIIEFLDLLELYSDIITSNNNDEVFNVNTTEGLEDLKLTLII